MKYSSTPATQSVKPCAPNADITEILKEFRRKMSKAALTSINFELLGRKIMVSKSSPRQLRCNCTDFTLDFFENYIRILLIPCKSAN